MTESTPVPAAPPSPAPAPAPDAPPVAAAPLAPASPLGREVPAAPPAPAAPTMPEWMGTFPDDLKADKSLEAFYGKEPSDLAKAYIETKRMVGERIMLPKADDPDSFARFAAAVRPEKADDYKIELPEGAPDDYATHMRSAFFEAGQQPWQVEKIVAANNAYVAQQALAAETAGEAVLTKLQSEMGADKFARSKQATVAMLDRLGIPVQFDTDLARMVGAENSLRLLFNLAERNGELGKIHDTDVRIDLGMMTPEAAQAEANRMTKETPLAKLNDPTSVESRRLDELAAIIAAAKKAG